MQFAKSAPSLLGATPYRALAETGRAIVRRIKKLRSGMAVVGAIAAVLLPAGDCAAVTAPPQVKKVYLKSDGAYLQWKAIFADDYNWDFNSDVDRGATLEIFGLQGLAAGESIETRVKLNTQQKAPVLYTTVDYMGAGGKWLKTIQYNVQGSVSGKEVVGYVDLAILAKAGISLPSDPSKLTYGNYYVYCGNQDACPNTDIPGSAFTQLTMLDNNWQLILDTDSPRTILLTQAECLFTWAAKSYPDYFAAASGQSQTLGAYYYQHWAGSNSILGIATDKQRVVYVGPLSGGGLLDLGDLASWLGMAGCK